MRIEAKNFKCNQKTKKKLTLINERLAHQRLKLTERTHDFGQIVELVVDLRLVV
jgi:hypothetical protein